MRRTCAYCHLGGNAQIRNHIRHADFLACSDRIDSTGHARCFQLPGISGKPHRSKQGLKMSPFPPEAHQREVLEVCPSGCVFSQVLIERLKNLMLIITPWTQTINLCKVLASREKWAVRLLPQDLRSIVYSSLLEFKKECVCMWWVYLTDLTVPRVNSSKAHFLILDS